jgi:hypothetical protein
MTRTIATRSSVALRDCHMIATISLSPGGDEDFPACRPYRSLRSPLKAPATLDDDMLILKYNQHRDVLQAPYHSSRSAGGLP